MSLLFGDNIPGLRHHITKPSTRSAGTRQPSADASCDAGGILGRRGYDLALSKPSSTSKALSFSSAMWSISALRSGVQPCFALFSAMGGV